MRVCPTCGEENSDRARFCQSCATPLEASQEPRAEVRKVVTIVFSDVTGSTALGERLDPEALRRVMERYFDAMAAVIRSHGGTVEKFIGDAVMAVFGIPQLHEDDPVRAVRAAAGMREALEALNVELDRDHGVGIAIRIGVNTGEIVAGDPISGQRLVTGDAVNVAARLEQAAAPGEILLGESTSRLVRDAVDVEALDPLDLKGKSEGVPAFRLLEIRARTEGHERHLDSPLVGRQKELELLEQSLDRAVTERTSHLFTLLGPAGVGKSRLVREFLAEAAATATVLRGRCLSYGEGITFYPLGEVIHEAVGIGDADAPADAVAKLSRLLGDTPDGDRIATLIGGLFGWSDPGATQDGFWAVRKLFEHLAHERPVVVVFDDIHWAEPTFLDLIEHLADWTRDASLLLLCIARPELLEIRAGWGGGKMNATSILLEPLPNDAASHLLDNLLGRAEIPDAARARILDAADGNPLFVEEMLGMLIDDGLLKFEDGAWRGVDDLADITVPPTIQLLLAARLDRLDAEERAVIERGAVEGKVFHSGAVTSLAPERIRANVPTRLLALARKELIRPDRAEFAGEDAFRFRHLLIRDAAYQAMPKEQRADLHEAFARWLENAAGDRVAEYEEIVAFHEEQAYRYRVELGPPDERTLALGEAAAERLLESAERAMGRGDVPGARTMFERAAEIARGRARALALWKVARAAERGGEFGAVLEAATEAAAQARSVGDRPVELVAQVAVAEARSHTDVATTYDEVAAVAGRALTELVELGDPRATVARETLARYEFFAGHAATSLQMALAILDDPAVPISDRDRVAIEVTASAYFGPEPAEAVLALLERLAATLPDTPLARARYHQVRAAPLAMLDRPEESREAAARADALWEELGDDQLRMASGQMRGESERFLERPDLAEAEFREGMERLDRVGEIGFNSTMTALLATSLCDLERFDEAEPYVEKSRAMTAEDDVASQNAWRLAASRIAVARGDAERGLALAEEGYAFMEPTDYLAWIAESHERIGEAALAAGDVERARSALTAARDGYAEKQILRWARRLDAKLAEL
jgi:class 3 adenylate cyclase